MHFITFYNKIEPLQLLLNALLLLKFNHVASNSIPEDIYSTQQLHDDHNEMTTFANTYKSFKQINPKNSGKKKKESISFLTKDKIFEEQSHDETKIITYRLHQEWVGLHLN